MFTDSTTDFRVSQSADKLLHEAITWFANTWFTNWPSYPYRSIHAYIHTRATVSTPAGVQFHIHKYIFIVQVQFEIHVKATLKLPLDKPYAPLFDCFTTVPDLLYNMWHILK